MKLLIFAVRDAKAEVFSHPIFAQAVGAAIRAFSDAVNDVKSVYGQHPEDYTLFQIGSYDDERGAVVPIGTGIVPLGNGATYLTARDPHQLQLEA